MPLFDDPPSRGPRRVTLIRLSGEVAKALGGIGRVVVEGEVHLTGGRPFAGWFTLRDRAAQVSVRVPRAAGRVRVVHGERVEVTGSLQWDNGRGQLLLVADDVVPVGAGAVAAMIAEARASLAADGLLTRPRRPIPLLPARVGVVCGAEAAVIRDIEAVVAARFPGYPLVVATTPVSGSAAANGICEALARVAGTAGVEVVILARGGGDSTALLPWSSEEVCRAVAASPVPVVSAIGHDGDRPLCDEVADLRCGTPSIAAATVVPDRGALTARCDSALAAARAAAAGRCERAGRRHDAANPAGALAAGAARAAARLERAGDRLAFADPRRRVGDGRRRLAGLEWRRPVWERLARAGGRLDADARHLEALAPARVLERGYAVVRAGDGTVVRAAAAVAPGDVVGVEVAEGAFTAVVR
ncbi:MAG TPA: exodeoxyribonuclease VII large subunit [Acidimicrobiales bacterium]|nr:exodeoxyribonuclease VII large subunit [Acidimicrobiales bacterium]